MNKLFIEDIDLKDKRVIVRVDFNVPLRDGKVENDKRLRATLPTIKYLREKGARIILMSHLGRPKGKVVEEMRLAPVGAALGDLLGVAVKSIPTCVGPEAKAAAEALGAGEILLRENLRFHPEEEGNDAAFAAQLAELADVYVNDAFGTAHRAHASTAGITAGMDQSAAGYLMKAELDFLAGRVLSPERPFVSIIGGAKVSSKIGVIEAMLEKVDTLLLGGAMTHTFLAAQKHGIGKSIYEGDKVELAGELLKKGGDKIKLPTDYIVTDHFDFADRELGPLKTVAANGIPADHYAVDIGPESRAEFEKYILGAKTVLWNGPMGVFEIDASAQGTFAAAEAMAKATGSGATTIIGGGDSAAAVEKAGLQDKISHISTGGGASLEFLEGKKLPGVEALNDK